MLIGVSPSTKEFAQSLELVSSKTFSEQISLLFVSINFLQNKRVTRGPVKSWIHIEIVSHKVIFNSNMFGPRGQPWGCTGGDTSIVVFKDLGFDQ